MFQSAAIHFGGVEKQLGIAPREISSWRSVLFAASL